MSTRRWVNSVTSRFVLAICLAGMFAGTASGETDAYLARQVWTGSGPPVSPGVLIVRDGKIVAAGGRADVTVPSDARVRDLGDGVLIPGLVVGETGLARDSGDGDEALAPRSLAIDGFDFFEQQHQRLAGGVTTAQISPGRARLVPGQGAVVKLAGESIEDRTLRRRESLRVLLTRDALNPPRIYEPPVGAVSVDRPLLPTSPQPAGSLAGAVSTLRAVLRAAEKHAPDQPVGSIEEEWLLDAFQQYRQSQHTIRITATTAAEIRAAISLAREFDLRILLVDPEELAPFAGRFDQWTPHVIGVVLNARLRPGRIENRPVPEPDAKPQAPPWKFVPELVESGIKVAIRPPSESDLPELLFSAGLFLRSGLPKETVLAMITRDPAQILGVEDRVGRLTADRDADFVVLSDEPFVAGSFVRETYVGGRQVYRRDSEPTTRVLRAGAVHDGTGNVIRDGSIVIQDAKIRQVGRTVSAPQDAVIQSFPDAVIVPGFIDLASGLGLGGPLSGNVPLQTKLGEQLYSGDPAVPIARRGGVTTVLLGSTGNSPSPLVAFKLGDELNVVRDPVALRFSVEGNLTTVVPSLRRTITAGKNYADSWTKYEEQKKQYEQKLKEYEAAKAKYDADRAEEAKKKEAEKKEAEKKEAEKKNEAKENGSESQEKEGDGDGEEGKEEEGEGSGDKDDEKESEGDDQSKADEDDSKKPSEESDAAKPPVKPDEPKKPNVNAALEPYRALFAREIPAFVEAKTGNEIKEAIKLFRQEFDLRAVLIGADDLVRDSRPLVEAKQLGVSLGPTLTSTVERKPMNPAQMLANRRIPFGFQSQATTGVADLPLAVQFAVHKGLGASDALRGLTSSPAKLLSLDDRIGELAAGKDADLVLLSGPPFELSTEVLAVMIDGEWVFQKETAR